MKFNYKVLTLHEFNIKKYSVFEKLSIPELTQILIEYYLKEKPVKVLIKQYGLKTVPTKFGHELPEIDLLDRCPYDGQQMWVKLPTRAYMDQWEMTATCFKCDQRIYHDIPDKKCMCAHCRHRRESQLRAEQQLIEDQSRVAIPSSDILANQLLALQGKPIDQFKLSFQNVFDIAVVLNAFQTTDLLNIGRLVDQSLLPDEQLAFNRLIDQKLLAISPESDPAVFTLINGVVHDYLPEKVNWSLMVTYMGGNLSELNPISMEDALDEFKHPSRLFNLDTAVIDSIYWRLVKQELTRIFEYRLDEMKFTIKSDREKMDIQQALGRWMTSYTPAQIWAIIWRAVANANDSRTKGTWGNYIHHPISYIVKRADWYFIHLCEEKSELPAYVFPASVDPQLTTNIFFSEILGKTDWFMHHVPASLGISDGYVHTLTTWGVEVLNQQANSNFHRIKEIVKSGKWFSETDYGLVVNDGNVCELYAEQGDAYAFFKHQGYTSMSSTTWYKPEDDPFFLTDFYSFAFLRRLRRALVIAGTKEISQDDFHNSSMLFTYK
ncbi:hypothetical protein EFO98_09075 [Lactiplantibacillus argentoratensis]|uniref:hypothetical protein n=1 Tax=Lactiplantibacillus argentoratensis TaxID=271881 RepID=UPI0021AAED07|nr:hypothetical protein [Lactiplantibacillus argentoratensis]MCT4443865.1 hypothetical protein [Lactiplantibacillus argentoratensis]